VLPIVNPSPGNPVFPPDPEIPPEPEEDIPPIVEEPEGVDAGTALPDIPGPPSPPPGPSPIQPQTIIIQDGGNLVCSTYEDLCNDIIFQRFGGLFTSNDCQPSTASDVPGPLSLLCWNDGLPTWYPRQRYVMTNSSNKWPDNAQLFNALLPLSPKLYSSITSEIILYWDDPNKNIESSSPVTSYNIYVNDNLYVTLPVTDNSYIFKEGNGNYSIFMTAVRDFSESLPSNIINESITL